ncbi:hypothetical protein LAC79_29020 [Ensifer adhaerens]|nr:hypothetical protein [Ensifer adhaerens]
MPSPGIADERDRLRTIRVGYIAQTQAQSSDGLAIARQRSVLQICHSAIAVLVGAVTLLLFGIEGVTGAVVIVIADILVVSAAILTMYKRIVQVEAKLDAAKSAIRELEITEGRRQVFSAKTSVEHVTSSAGR